MDDVPQSTPQPETPPTSPPGDSQQVGEQTQPLAAEATVEAPAPPGGGLAPISPSSAAELPQAEEEARLKAERLRAEEEARLKAEARRKAEEEATRVRAEEEKRQRAAAENEERKRVEAARLKAEEEAARLRPIPESIAQPPAPDARTALIYLSNTTDRQIAPPPATAAEKRVADSAPKEADSAAAKELGLLSLQIDEFYDACLKRARRWMTLLVLFLGFELFLIAAFILSFVINYQSELLTGNNFAGNLITWRNTRIIIGAIFILVLLIIRAARFEKRWKLNQTTLTELAKLKVELTKLPKDLTAIRKDLLGVVNNHNEAMKSQLVFLGPKVSAVPVVIPPLIPTQSVKPQQPPPPG